jgi:antitoxin ParD1/3/4
LRGTKQSRYQKQTQQIIGMDIANVIASFLAMTHFPKKNRKLYCIKYQYLVSLIKKIMARNTSILLGDYFENFINEQIASGKYNSVSEVVRTALRVFEQEENKTKSLINELKIGEKSAKIKNFDRKKNLEQLKTNFEK